MSTETDKTIIITAETIQSLITGERLHPKHKNWRKEARLVMELITREPQPLIDYVTGKSKYLRCIDFDNVNTVQEHAKWSEKGDFYK